MTRRARRVPSARDGAPFQLPAPDLITEPLFPQHPPEVVASVERQLERRGVPNPGFLLDLFPTAAIDHAIQVYDQEGAGPNNCIPRSYLFNRARLYMDEKQKPVQDEAPDIDVDSYNNDIDIRIRRRRRSNSSANPTDLFRELGISDVAFFVKHYPEGKLLRALKKMSKLKASGYQARNPAGLLTKMLKEEAPHDDD